MIDFSRTTIIVGEDADSLIEAGSCELLARWCEVDVENGRDVVLVNHLGFVKFTHIKGVAIRVFVAL